MLDPRGFLGDLKIPQIALFRGIRIHWRIGGTLEFFGKLVEIR